MKEVLTPLLPKLNTCHTHSRISALSVTVTPGLSPYNGRCCRRTRLFAHPFLTRFKGLFKVLLDYSYLGEIP